MKKNAETMDAEEVDAMDTELTEEQRAEEERKIAEDERDWSPGKKQKAKEETRAGGVLAWPYSGRASTPPWPKFPDRWIKSGFPG